MVSALFTSAIRTYVPLAVAFIANILAKYGLQIDSDALVLTVSTGAAAVYYVVIRRLEARWPRLGWLLGKPGAPVYEAKHTG